MANLLNTLPLLIGPHVSIASGEQHCHDPENLARLRLWAGGR